MEEALFNNIKAHIVKNLNEANDIIRIAVAWFTNDDLFQVVLNMLDRGIKVELILIDDCINRNEYGLNFGLFIAKGGHLFFSSSERNMHNKFCVIDNKILITGSYNWTYYAENKNWENVLITDEQVVVNDYAKEFDEIKAHLLETKDYKSYKLNEIEPIALLSEYDYLYEDLIIKGNNTGMEYLNYLTVIKDSIIIERKSSVENPKVTTTAVRKDITNHSLGIRCTIDGKPDCTSIIIPKGTEFPCEKSGEYFTLEDNQTSLMCETLLGDNLDAKLNRIVGKIVLNDIPKLPKAQGKMKVVFRLSYDKTLHVIATNMHTRSYVEAYYYLKELL